MNRWWGMSPMFVVAAIPLATVASAPVVALEALAGLLCAAGIGWRVTGLVSAGAAFAMIGYAVALRSAATDIDIVGAGVFGLALLSLIQLSEFVRHFDGALIARDVVRAQFTYWLGRALLAGVAVALLMLAGSVLALAVPGSLRAFIVGTGAVIAFVGAVRVGIVRRPGST